MSYYYKSSCCPNSKEAVDMAIKALEQQESERWIPVSERLPEETGYYRCSVEWYGTSTKELLIGNGNEIKNRVIDVHFLKSENAFKTVDGYCTFKVIAWKPIEEPYSE